MAECQQHNYARALNFIEKYRIQPEEVGSGANPARAISSFCEHYGLLLKNNLAMLEPEALGQIASQGLSVGEAKRRQKTSMEAADRAMTCVYDPGGDSAASGMAQLVHLATMAMLAEVFDILRQRLDAKIASATRQVEIQMH